jgi:3-(3-hydroxy-phenyl)propionate hydroxylase
MPGYTLPVYPYRTPPEISRKARTEYPVIIAGAGLGGLCAALELGSRGIQAVVLDDDDSVGASGLSSRGICYAKHTLEILERFGVSQRIREKGITWNEGDVFRGDERLYRFNLQPEGGQQFPAFVNLQQFYVEQYLVERIAQVPAIDLRWKNKVVEVRVDADGVELEVETPDGRYGTRCRYLVGADGAHSIVREKIGAKDAESALFENHWCIADVRIAASEKAVRKAYLDNPLNEGGAIWYHQMADGVWRTDWLIGHYADPDAEATPARATERLKKLLGPDTPFEIVWVGPWRFRKRYVERMVHGRVCLLGDAAAQHSPFGARGGNRAVQDANNLAWKLALVLEGKAHPDLIETYHAERHHAARECVELASRSALFIGPESEGQRLVRDAILDLAQAHAWARPLVNTGRLSVATAYTASPLNVLDCDAFEAPDAQPGAAAPDGELLREGRATHLAARLQGQFSVVFFADGPAPGSIDISGVPVQVLRIDRSEARGGLLDRYGVKDSATYVFRPDGHVLARCSGVEAMFARNAIEQLLGYRTAERVAPAPADAGRYGQLEQDRLHDALAVLIDRLPAEQRSRALARLAVTLAARLGDYEAALDAIRLSGGAENS